MNKDLCTLIMMAMMFLSPVAFAGDAYAPKVEVPKNVSQNSPQFMSVMMINAAKVPDKSAVEIPAYPKARIYQTRDAGEAIMNDKKVKTLSYIKMLSTDSPDKIVAWYKKQLKGYTFEDVFGMSWVFWKGKGKFNGLDVRQLMTIQNVGISEAIAAMGYDKDMKGAKSVIEINYVSK